MRKFNQHCHASESVFTITWAQSVLIPEMRCGQRTFWLNNKEDQHTCLECIFLVGKSWHMIKKKSLRSKEGWESLEQYQMPCCPGLFQFSLLLLLWFHTVDQADYTSAFTTLKPNIFYHIRFYHILE